MEKEIDILRRQVKDLQAEILSLKQKQHSPMQDTRSHIACEQAALDLKEEMKFRETFIQSLPGFFVVINSNGKTALINDSMLQALGYTKDEVVGRDYLATLVPESEREKVSRVFQELIQTNEPTISENHIIAKDGKELLMEWQGRCVFNKNGKVDCFYGVGTNITERKRMEDALRVSEEIFNSFMEHCPVYVFFKDETTRPIRLSRNYEKMLGRPMEDILGKTMDQLFPSELSKKMVEDDLSVIRNGKPIEVVEELNGRIFETTKFPIVQPGKSSLLAGFTVDITDRRRTEEALLQSEELYRGIFENASIGITRVSLDGIYREVNPAMTRILGYSAAELTGRPVADFTYPDDLRRRAHFLSDLIEGRIVSGEQERRFVHKNGSVVWTLITASVQRAQSGKPLYFISLVLDITERKQTEEALQESEIRFRALVESAPEAIFVQSAGRFVYLNQTACRLFGASHPEDLLGKDFMERIAPEYRDKIRERIRLQSETGKPSSLMEQEYLRLDGSRVPVETTAVAIRYRGEDAHMVFIRDITERKRAEEELRDSEERHRKIIEASSDAFLLRSNGDMVIYANPAALKLFRANHPGDLIGKRYSDLVHPDDRAISAERVKKSIDENSVSPVREHRILALDGQVVHVESIGGLVKHRGEAQIFGVFRDITERKLAEQEKQKAETQLRQAQKMEAIGSLAGGIAHDFNNILSVIIGNAEILQMSDVSSDVKDGLHQVFAASQRAKQLVRQILAFSRQGEHQKLLMSLKPVVKETLDFLRASIPSTIKLQHYIKPDAGAVVADSTQMQQVLMNLCANAAHAMEEKGGVLKIVLDTKTIAEEDVRLDPEVERGDYVRLTVSDTGHGIEPGVLHRIFDPYFTTKGPDKGTGLGLAVVHGIVKSHGGTIKVDSEVGKGTVFHVLFPRADDVIKKRGKRSPAIADWNRKDIGCR